MITFMLLAALGLGFVIALLTAGIYITLAPLGLLYIPVAALALRLAS